MLEEYKKDLEEELKELEREIEETKKNLWPRNTGQVQLSLKECWKIFKG
jgi:sugar-specific transcriptional regulator TrmB